MALQPLSGLRVLDFTAFPPGAYCALLLADLGAEIIHVEDPAQKGRPSLLFGQMAMSRAKRSIALDQRHADAAEVLCRLVSAVDVVIENARPGAMDQRGFGYSHATAANPKIVWCAITGFGQTGPYAQHAGHDLAYTAHSGLLGALSADPDFHPGAQVSVPLGAMSAVVGIQAALLQRVKYGKGAFVDISLSEAATWSLTGGINPLSQAPMIIPATPDRRTYACADGRQVAVTSAEPRTWNALCEGLGLPELKTLLHRPEEATASTRRLAERFLTRPAAEWVQLLASAGAAVTMVNRGAQLLDDPQIRARGTIAEVEGVPVPVSPVHLRTADGETTAPNLAGAPWVGADTQDILASAGFGADEIAALIAGGIVA